jgi:hypothetical protein
MTIGGLLIEMAIAHVAELAAIETAGAAGAAPTGGLSALAAMAAGVAIVYDFIIEITLGVLLFTDGYQRVRGEPTVLGQIWGMWGGADPLADPTASVGHGPRYSI